MCFLTDLTLHCTKVKKWSSYVFSPIDHYSDIYIKESVLKQCCLQRNHPRPYSWTPSVPVSPKSSKFPLKWPNVRNWTIGLMRSRGSTSPFSNNTCLWSPLPNTARNIASSRRSRPSLAPVLPFRLKVTIRSWRASLKTSPRLLLIWKRSWS